MTRKFLSKTELVSVISILKEGTTTQTAIAEQFGVCPSAIHRTKVKLNAGVRLRALEGDDPDWTPIPMIGRGKYKIFKGGVPRHPRDRTEPVRYAPRSLKVG